MLRRIDQAYSTLDRIKSLTEMPSWLLVTVPVVIAVTLTTLGWVQEWVQSFWQAFAVLLVGGVVAAAAFAVVAVAVQRLAKGQSPDMKKIAEMEKDLENLRVLTTRRLRWTQGRDEYLKERDPTSGGQVVVYRVALDNPTALPVEGVRVTVDECSTDQSFVKRRPVRMRDQPNEEIVATGITAYPEVVEYPQILEVLYERGRVAGIYPSVISPLPGHRISPGEHILTLAATSSADTITRKLRVVVTNDPKDPVTISPLD